MQKFEVSIRACLFPYRKRGSDDAAIENDRRLHLPCARNGVFVALWVASYFWLVGISCRLNSEERLAMNSERGSTQLEMESHDTWRSHIPTALARDVSRCHGWNKKRANAHLAAGAITDRVCYTA